MPRLDSVTREAHRARVLRSVSAVLAYLRMQFPKSQVEVFPRNGNSVEYGMPRFEIWDGRQRIMIRVTDEVLDLDADSVMQLVRQLPVARMIRNAVPGDMIVVKRDAVAVESAQSSILNVSGGSDD